jgi:catalase
MTSKKNRAPYHPNRFDALPTVPPEHGGFASYREKVEGIKERMHGPKFSVSYITLGLRELLLSRSAWSSLS